MEDAKRECEQPLLSSQIINGSVTQNKSAETETTRMRKLAEMEYCAKSGWKRANENVFKFLLDESR